MPTTTLEAQAHAALAASQQCRSHAAQRYFALKAWRLAQEVRRQRLAAQEVR